MPQILPPSAENTARAVELLRAGKLVVFPTETVYGLGADATDGKAVAAIYAAKGRPEINPLIIHVVETRDLDALIEWNETARLLAASFWPGPLTLVLPRRKDCSVSLLASAGLDTLAVRVPSHPVARDLLKAFGKPIAAPSANLSGKLSPTTPLHVAESLGDKVDLILAGGKSAIGLESTVVDCTKTRPVILRPGGVTKEQLEKILDAIDELSVQQAKEFSPPLGEGSGEGYTSLLHPSPAKTKGLLQQAQVFASSPARGEEPFSSPGQMESHYAPDLPLRMNAASAADDEGFLTFGSDRHAKGGAARLNLSPQGDLNEAAANLFSMLRQLDRKELRGIAVMPIPETGLGVAINDRLRRASVR